MSAVDKSPLLFEGMKQFCACCYGDRLPLWPVFAAEDFAHPECANASEDYCTITNSSAWPSVTSKKNFRPLSVALTVHGAVPVSTTWS